MPPAAARSARRRGSAWLCSSLRLSDARSARRGYDGAMSQHLTILTGASRGMGLAMAEQLIDGGHDLLCISRKHNDALGVRATEKGVRCEQWPQDLVRADMAAMRVEAWLTAR